MSAEAPGSTLVSPTAAAPLPRVPSWTLGRLTKIEVQNYRGVRGTLTLSLPKGENLLIYGENGAGKSSLFHAVRDFLESSEREHFDREKMAWRKLSLKDYAHRFTTDAPRVSLHFGAHEMAWSAQERGPEQNEARDLDKGKGFLDYKALQAMHLLERQALDIDLFPLVIEHLLPHYPNTATAGKLTFSQQWRDFLKRSTKAKKGEPAPTPVAQQEVDEFNAGFGPEIKRLSDKATELLKCFGADVAVALEFSPASLKPAKKGATKLVLHPPRLLAYPSLRRLGLRDYDRVLNEARLSALALCLFFAALKDSPSTSLRILALDDILIGLDMTNRVKVLDLLHEHFADWQILIFTYSKAWFERLKDRVKTPGWSADWKPVTLWEEWFDGDNSPIIRAEGSGDALETAARHLARKDYKAAAVYARSALEAACHRICAKACMFLLHVEQPKQRKLEHFLNALAPRLGELVDATRRARALVLLARLEQARSFVLNRNAHFDVEEEDTLSGEVGTALNTVREFITFLGLQSWENEHFQSNHPPSPLGRMTAELAAARSLAAQSATRQCQEPLKQAHEWFWQLYGVKLGVKLPLGTEPNATTIRAAAEDLLPADVKARLTAAQSYLFGSIKGDKFAPAKFEEAAKLLEELTTA